PITEPPRYGDQVGRMELPTGCVEELREIVQSARVAEPDGHSGIRDGPVVALAPEDLAPGTRRCPPGTGMGVQATVLGSRAAPEGGVRSQRGVNPLHLAGGPSPESCLALPLRGSHKVALPPAVGDPDAAESARRPDRVGCDLFTC